MTCGKHFEVFFSVYLQMKIKNLHEKNICFGLSSEIITVSLMKFIQNTKNDLFNYNSFDSNSTNCYYLLHL